MRRASIKHQLRNILSVAILFAHRSNAQTCTFCENGITNPTLALTEGGDETCADVPFLIVGELDDSIACTTYKESELLCCPTQIIVTNPCTFCENGVTYPALVVPEGGDQTCAEVKIVAAQFSSDEDACAVVREEESSCCPPEVSVTLPAVPVSTTMATIPIVTTTTVASDTTTSAATESPTPATLVTLSPTMKPVTSQPTLSPTDPIVVTTSPTTPLTQPPPATGTGIISGVAFYDSNNNGNFEPLQEYGVWGIEPSLYSCGDDTTSLAAASTSTQGVYQFEDLAVGSYYVKFDYPTYYMVNSVWSGDPSTPSVQNSANPSNGITNCFTLDDGAQIEADVAFVFNPNPVPATTPAPTAVATPPPTIPPVATLPPTELSTIAATTPPTIAVNQTTTTVAATQSPTAVDIVTASPTLNTIKCPFCEDGIPDPMITISTGQTCGKVKEISAGHIDGSDICTIIQEDETVCCPEPIANPCTFCEDGIPDEDYMTAGGITCGAVKALAIKESADSMICSLLQQPESECCAPPALDNPCSFCDDGMPDPDYVVPGTKLTCTEMKSNVGEEVNGSNLCAAIQQVESSCCPESPITNAPISPAPTSSPTPQVVAPTSFQPTPEYMSRICTFCEDGMIDARLEIPGTGGRTCGSQKDRAENLNGLTGLCRTIQQSEAVCCPEPITNPCTFCEEGIANLDLELPQSGGRTCGTVNALAATMELDSELCTTIKQAEILCCAQPAVPTTSPVASKVPTVNVASPISPLPSDLVGPVTRSGIEMLMVGVENTEKVTVWQEYTAAFIVDYFKKNPGIVYDVDVNVTIMFQQTSTTAEESTAPQGPIRRQLQQQKSTPSVVITYIQTTTYKTQYPDSYVYDEDFIAEEPFKKDSEGYIAMLKRVSSYYDPVSEVTVTVPSPTPPPSPPLPAAAKTPPAHDNASDNNTRYIIIGVVSGVVIVAVLMGLLIVRKRKRLNRDSVPQTSTRLIESDEDLESREISGAFESQGALAAAAALSNLNTSEIVPSSSGKFHVIAPEGKLGVVVETSPQGGPAYVTDLREESPLLGKVRLGDKIIAIDDEDVQHLSSLDISKLIARKSRNPQRKFTLLREEVLSTNEETNDLVDAPNSLDRSSNEGMIHIIAPVGKLGVVIATLPQGGPAYVSDLREGSPLLGKLHLGDKIIAIDDEDVQQLSSIEISKLIASKSRNPQRKFTLMREEGPSTNEERSDLDVAPNSPDRSSNEGMIHIIAPEGKLGVVIATLPQGGQAFVSDLREGSPLLGKLRLGDKIIAIDDEDVQQLSSIEISKLIAVKSRNPQRKFTILRADDQNEVPSSDESTDAEVVSAPAPAPASKDTSNERNVTIIAPKGKLGIALQNPSDGGHAYVSEIKDGSVFSGGQLLEGQIKLNDQIISIDGEDVRKLKAFHISKILAFKSENSERKIVVLRKTDQ